jgi:CIC family chloride channel protein
MLITREKIRQYFRNNYTDLALPLLIGVVCGLETIVVRAVIPSTFDWVMDIVRWCGPFGIPAVFGFLLAGAFLTGILTDKAAETSGVGLDVAVESYHLRSGMMPGSFAPLKLCSMLFTLGLGGSGGLVGPTAAIGQGSASSLSRWLRLPQDKSKILALCGIAGCISGLLHTPFGAAVFALEICYISGILYVDLVPVVIASISAYIVSARITRILPFGYLLEQPHLFRAVVHNTPFPWSLHYLLYCIIAALLTTFLGILFIKSFLALQNFNRKRIDARYGSFIGAILVGLIATVFFRHRLPDVLGHPGALIERCARGGYLLYPALTLLVGRWLTTFFTVGFGGSGGLFSPTVLMGGLAGTIVARILGITGVNVLVTTGMTAALTGVMNVPVAAVIIVVEVFGVSFIIPAAIGSAIAFLLAKNWVIYPHIRQFQEVAEQ